MFKIEDYTIFYKKSLKEALIRLNETSDYLVLFIINESNKLIGTLTDGDIRRALIKGVNSNAPLSEFYNKDFYYIRKDNYTQKEINEAKVNDIRILPIVDEDFNIIKLINFRIIKTILPIDAVLMAGGKGMRLRPLTENKPKPLLEIGGKPIIEYNMDRLNQFGIQCQYISINYLGDQIIDFCKNKNSDIQFFFIKEKEPLGTIGSVRLVDDYQNDYILVMNSDLLTNIDFADMFKSMTDRNADFIVASMPYEITLPYAVLNTKNRKVDSFKEKPTYTYYTNAGIYIFKKEILNKIPLNTYYNATDLMQTLIDNDIKVEHYPIRSYWLDIGNPQDFEKAQRDISHINFG